MQTRKDTTYTSRKFFISSAAMAQTCDYVDNQGLGCNVPDKIGKLRSKLTCVPDSLNFWLSHIGSATSIAVAGIPNTVDRLRIGWSPIH
mmetsp:Transcript_53956/g.132301  ORF Transcript_53956/g.132301 Transcript_53956/m.132301 type:complete len:89 (-) Transcript_53956:991-1257(-)